MADNTVLNPMAGGDVIQTEDFGASGKMERVKMVIGVKDTDNGDVSLTNPMPSHGNIASGITDSGNPVKTGGVYNSALPTLASGQRGDHQLDINGNQKVTLASLIAGEDLVNNKMVIEQRNTYANITTNTTTTVKGGPGFIHGIAINTHGGAGNTATLFDNTAASGTKIGTVDTNSGDGKAFDVLFTVGLTIVTATGTAPDLTVSYR